MTYEQIFRGELVLSMAKLHLVNRVAFMTPDGIGYPPGPETEAILLLNRLRYELKLEFELKKSRKRRKAA
jgi:hypothetical protein